MIGGIDRFTEQNAELKMLLNEYSGARLLDYFLRRFGTFVAALLFLGHVF